ncbi:MAG: prephenate dehydrogenase/arogenate dehydrogenase family protein [Spirochaetes bacterium]|jgi:prephenate dehydrogenase|nr:prephenate dehydrogenase/arogenate dehydrogenase family protein [Spirochaetota bacterium]
MFRRVSVVGLGLLGGSLCRALKEADASVHITAFARDVARLSRALSDGMIDRALPVGELSPAGFDLVVIASPVLSSIESLEKLLGHPEIGGCLIIDVGSVKAPLVALADAHMNGARFVGCHPMAGSEKSGYEHSSGALYRGASVIITPGKKNTEDDVRAVERFWTSLGARTVRSGAEEHDRLVAVTSHMPHLAACAVADLVADTAAGTDITPFIGNGFRDLTRIAMGSPDLWTDIEAANAENIVRAIDELTARLEHIRRFIAEGRHEAEGRVFLERAGAFRRSVG